MPHLAFCENCGSDRLDVVSRTSGGMEIRCYVCTKQVAVTGVILGEIDFLAGAQAKVDQMVAKAREKARQRAMFSR